MKQLTVLSLIFFLSSSHADLSEKCLNSAKAWVYSNTSSNSSESAEKGFEFCAAGGDVECLNDAKNWVYANTPHNNSESAEKAIRFCYHGEVSCLQPAKDWIYSNTSANHNQAAEKAILACGQPKKCK